MYQNAIKIILSLMLLVCLLNMPYGYYQAVRISGALGFTLLAYYCHEQNRKIEVIVYVLLALLFQPFIKVSLGRTIWNVVDVIVSVGLLGSFIFKRTELK
jgi:hypothetical protein